jgi:hypothetical protein
MKPAHRLAALAACCLLLLATAGCGDKPDPTKPTLAPIAAAP